jgi:hypothetical protein
MNDQVEVEVKVPTALIVKAFSILLDTYYYHPILWKLQYVCWALRDQRPNSFGRKEVRIHDYAHVARDKIWLHGMLGGTRDLLLYDVQKPFEAVMAFEMFETKGSDDEQDDCEKVFYRIPAAWLRYVYARHENCDVVMYLVREPFCCRQILVKGSVAVAQCHSNVIDARFAIHSNYFHVGIGDCWTEEHDVFAELNLYANVKQLYKLVVLYAQPYGNVREELLYALGSYEPTIQLKNNEGINVLFTGEKLKKLIKHLLVCKKCILRLPHFIEILHDSIDKYHPYPAERMNTVDDADSVVNNTPRFKYILDGDFDNLIQRAYNAPLEDYKNKRLNVCTDIIEPFMSCYM